MAGSPRATVDIAIDERVIVSSTLDNRENTLPVINETDFKYLNNKQLLQYIQKLQATFDQYKAQ